MINIDNEKSFVNALHKIASIADRWVTLQEAKLQELKDENTRLRLELEEKRGKKERGFE